MSMILEDTYDLKLFAVRNHSRTIEAYRVCSDCETDIESYTRFVRNVCFGSKKDETEFVLTTLNGRVVSAWYDGKVHVFKRNETTLFKMLNKFCF